MGKYRNVSGEDRFLVAGAGLVKVAVDEVADIDDTATDPQPSIWAPVTTGKKAAPAAKED